MKEVCMQELTRQSGTWRWGLLCLLFLAPLFFLSYGFANQYASGLAEVPVMVFGWEKPFTLALDNCALLVN